MPAKLAIVVSAAITSEAPSRRESCQADSLALREAPQDELVGRVVDGDADQRPAERERHPVELAEHGDAERHRHEQSERAGDHHQEQRQRRAEEHVGERGDARERERRDPRGVEADLALGVDGEAVRAALLEDEVPAEPRAQLGELRGDRVEQRRLRRGVERGVARGQDQHREASVRGREDAVARHERRLARREPRELALERAERILRDDLLHERRGRQREARAHRLRLRAQPLVRERPGSSRLRRVRQEVHPAREVELVHRAQELRVRAGAQPGDLRVRAQRLGQLARGRARATAGSSAPIESTTVRVSSLRVSSREICASSAPSPSGRKFVMSLENSRCAAL